MTFAGKKLESSGHSGILAKDPWAYSGASGGGITREFCPTCGSSLFITANKLGDTVSISMGTMDDPAGFQAQIHIWAHAEWDWAKLQDGLPR